MTCEDEAIDYDSIHSAAFQAGFQDAWEEFTHPDKPVGDPVLSSENYRFGWWCGIGEAKAWHEGFQAYENGLMFCPYLLGNDDDCFRESWLDGYCRSAGCAI